MTISRNTILYYLPKVLTNWLLGNPEVHYRPCMSSPLVPIFSKIYPISSITTHLPQTILILSSHLRLGLPKDLFLSLYMHFSTNTLYAVLDYSACATFPAHLSRLDLRFLIMLGEEFNACSSALCNFLHSPVISSLNLKYPPKCFTLEHP